MLFFQQTVFECEVGHDLVQHRGFAAQVLHLIGRRRPRRIAGEPPLAGLQEQRSNKNCDQS
jgi:hypothetical protein